MRAPPGRTSTASGTTRTSSTSPCTRCGTWATRGSPPSCTASRPGSGRRCSVARSCPGHEEDTTSPARCLSSAQTHKKEHMGGETPTAVFYFFHARSTLGMTISVPAVQGVLWASAPSELFVSYLVKVMFSPSFPIFATVKFVSEPQN